MDLFPKDYKKNETNLPTMAGKPSLALVLNKIKDRFSSSGSGGRLTVATKTKGILMKLGVILSSAVFILVLLLWGSLAIYKNVLTGQINDLKKQQSEVFNDKDKEMAAKIVDLEKGSMMAQGLLKSHLYASSAFDKLAAATVPRVQWQSFDLMVKDNSISVKGFSADYATLAKQILALTDSGFLNIFVSGISMDKSGGVGFGAILNFDPKILQKQ